MSEPHENIDPHFFQLVLSLQAGAMQQMGKVASAISGKIERDLEIAGYSIDIINMLNTKMAGNLTKEESKFLELALYELRLNYVDEVKKDETKKTEAEPAGKDKESSRSKTERKEEDPRPESSEPDPSDSTDQ